MHFGNRRKNDRLNCLVQWALNKQIRADAQTARAAYSKRYVTRMKYLLFVILMTNAGLSWSLDISCSEQDIKLSDQDLGIIELRENFINKTEASYTLFFPNSYEGRNFSYSALLIGTVENWSLLTELQTHAEGERLAVFVSKNPNFNEQVCVSISYGQCLTQTIRLP